MERILDLLKEVTKSYGVQMKLYGEDLSNLENYDGGLRSHLFPNFKAEHFAESLQSIIPGTMYITKDIYSCFYCLFRTPESVDPPIGYCIIGPWLDEKPDDTTLDSLIKRYNIPYHLKFELIQYFNSVTQITSPDSWRSALYAFMVCLYDKPAIGYLTYFELDVNNPAAGYNPEPEAILTMQKTEEYYNIENALIDAVSKGDGKIAFQFFAKHRRYRDNHRWAKDELRYWKDYIITLNTLARKAAEQGYVHPLHIDTASTDFILRIEAVSTIAELNKLSDTIIHHYCKLVRDFSLKGYSPLVRNIINFVDFNLKEPLSLKVFAKQLNVNASYLSDLFKREKGITLTDYINLKRIQHAASLLRNPGIFIQDVAEQCGFLDFNYFTRLFKRHYKVSPRKFKAQFKE